MQFRLLLIFVISFCIISETISQTPEKVLLITQAQYSGDYYRSQAQAWEKVTKSEPKNADAWLNYFCAARYSNIFNKGDKYDLGKIADAVSGPLPGSFEAQYLKFWANPWSPEAMNYLEKAYQIAPHRPETYDAFISNNLQRGNLKAYKEFCIKYFNSPENSPGQMNWNHNALVNLEPNAILLTEGDNDTYPAWILQEVKNFRKDILVLNTNLIMSNEYRNMIFQNLALPTFDKKQEEIGRMEFRKAIVDHIVKNTTRPVYFGIGIVHEIREAYEDNLFLIGLSFKYSKKGFDNLAVLRKSYENDFRLDYLKMSMSNDPSQVELDRYSRSYLPSLIKVYEHYAKAGDVSKAKEIKSLALLIGKKSNTLEATKKTLAKY